MSCGKRLKHLGALGLNSDKDNENDIKRAYKKMALKYHPDKNPGDENATRKFQEISEAYRFLAEGGKDLSDDDWQSDSDSGSDYGPRFRFHRGGGAYSYVDPDDDLLLYFLLSQMFNDRRGGSSTTFTSGRTRQKPTTSRTTREKSPVVEAKQAPSYEESEKERIKREKRQAKKKRQKERRNNEKNADKKDDKENTDRNRMDENQNESKSDGDSRQGSPDPADDEDEAKLLYEFLADKHGFQPDKDSMQDGNNKGRKDCNKTFDEWKAERQGGKSKNEMQAEQKKRDEEAKSIGEELKKKAQIKEEKERRQKAKQQKQKEEKERKEKEEEEKRQKEMEADAKRKKKQEEEATGKKNKSKQNETKSNKSNSNNNNVDNKGGGKAKGGGGGQKMVTVEASSESESESESEDDGAYFEAAAPKETKEATVDAGFVSSKKTTKNQKIIDRERLNTQKRLPDFMLKETDPIKRMKYKTEICKLYIQTGVCPKRDYCVYAHGKHEMRLKPKCQMCFKWQAGYCPFMEDASQCVFAHGEDEFQPEFAEIYLTVHPEIQAKNAAADRAAIAAASRPIPPAPNPYDLDPTVFSQQHHEQHLAAPPASTIQPASEPAPRGMVLGPRDVDGGYMTIQPASEMEEMEMLRRAIEISMMEEKSRKTEQMLINNPVSLSTRLSADASENTVILGLRNQNIPPPHRSARTDTAGGTNDSSLFPSFHNESPVTGLPLYAAAPPRSSGLSELRQNSEPLRDSPTRALGNLAPIGTPPPPKQTATHPLPSSASHANPGVAKVVGGAVAVTSAAVQPATLISSAKSTRLPPGLGTSNITPLATEEVKPKMNGLYDDTAVIMPSFQNDPYNFEAEFQSDGSEEFVSDDEFDTPIFTGVPPIAPSLLSNPLAPSTLPTRPSQFVSVQSQDSQLHELTTEPPSLQSEPQSQQLPTPSPEPAELVLEEESVTKSAPMKNGTAVADNRQTNSEIEENPQTDKNEVAKASSPKTTAPKQKIQPPANYQKRHVVYSNKLCKHGSLCWSVICPFRHPERESGGAPTIPSEDTKTLPPFKTRECWKFMKYRDCPYGNGCHFAHGKHELRSFDTHHAH